MRKKFDESWFPRLYLWAAKAKYQMGVLFAFCVFAYLVFGMLSGAEGVAVGFITALEMVLACFLIGVAQQIIMPGSNFNKTRCAVWVLTGTAVLTACALVFKWFAAMPVWCLVCFVACVVLAMIALVYGYYLELGQETKLLNSQLEKFQQIQNAKAVNHDVRHKN